MPCMTPSTHVGARSTPRDDPVTRRGGRLHERRVLARLAIVVAVAVVMLMPVGIVLGADPTAVGATPSPTLNPGQQKKSTPTPPAATPTPPLAATPPPAPATPTPAPTAAPGSTAAPTAAPAGSAPPTARPGSGPTVAKPTAAPMAGPTASPGAPSLAAPDPSGDVAGAGSSSGGAGTSGDRSSPAVLLLVVAVLGIIAGLVWFILGRRRSDDDEKGSTDASTATPGTARQVVTPAVAVAATRATNVPSVARATRPPRDSRGTANADVRRGTARDSSLGASPGSGAPRSGPAGARVEDPLMAAMARSREPRAGARSPRTAAAPAVEPDGSTFAGPTWVNRLDPRIRVEPELETEKARITREASRTAEHGPSEVGTAPNAA